MHNVQIFRVQTKRRLVIPLKSCIYADVKYYNVPDFDVDLNSCHNVEGLMLPNCVKQRKIKCNAF